MPLLTIITATFNDLPGLRTTLASLAALQRSAGPDLEILVVDGGTLGVSDCVSEPGMPTVTLSSQTDLGVYDAMNRGLELSTGDHVWFLNGGDESMETEWARLADELREAGREGLLYGYERQGRRRSVAVSPRAIEYLWHGLPTSHQAIVYPGDAARAWPYDLSYRMSADYAFTAKLAKESVTGWRTVARPLARFRLGGQSSDNMRAVARDAARVQREIWGSGGLHILMSQIRHWGNRVARAVHVLR